MAGAARACKVKGKDPNDSSDSFGLHSGASPGIAAAAVASSCLSKA